MSKLLNILFYYILILLGLIITSWIIWSRFIRGRVIRDIPDALLTEYRFWILLYICCIYIFAIKNLIKKTTPNVFFNIIGEITSKYFWKPLVLLDHTIKYNIYCKDYYYNWMIYLRKHWDKSSENWKRGFILSFSIIPRMFLVTILLLDTFYFEKIEIFYKLVLIGLLPFSFRYMEYSVNDFYEYLVKCLTDKYDEVLIFEKGYSYIFSRKNETKAVWHFEWVSVEEYIEILYDTYLDNIIDKTSYEYEGSFYCKEDVYKKYEQKFNKPISSWTREEHNEVKKLSEELTPEIFELKITLYLFQSYKTERNLVWAKIVLFSMYLICWGYILIISYYNYPVDLPMFKYLVNNIMGYLTIGEDPFTGGLQSLNKNLITMQSIKNLILNIVNNLKK